MWPRYEFDRRERSRGKALIALLLATTAIGCATIATQRSAYAQTAGRQAAFNIPAGSLAGALALFGRQAGLQVTYLPEITTGKQSPGVSGTIAPREALTRLLQGSGLSYQFTNVNTVAISGASAAASSAATVDGAIQLDTVEVSGSRVSRADQPFQTPGSVNYISEQDIQRFRGRTTGDIFQGTPGVISGMNRNGAAIDVNIRGLQGMNRVATTIDGSEQSTSSYRGYSGVDNRSYVDPDLIGGVTITKGPNEGSSGAIGGAVAMETLNASDILRPGDTYGVRVKGGMSTNGTPPQIGSTKWLHGPPSTFDFDNWVGSAAVAVTKQNIDIVGAYVRRIAGNYFAGTNGPLYTENFRGGVKALSNYRYGDEVFNTSQNSSSALLKATLRPADDHELKLSYMRYENNFGEILPTMVASGTGGIFTTTQLPLSEIALDQFTARYHWKPTDNSLVDLRVNTWMSSTDELTSTRIGAKSKTYGVDASNASRFDINSTLFTLSYGGSFKLEDAESDYRLRTEVQNILGSIAPDGRRQIGTLFAKGKWEPTPWLAFDAGATYLTYQVANRAEPYWSYKGLPYTGYEGSGISPNFGATVTPLPGWQLFAKYAAGIRPPSLREATWNASGLRFNPNIVAEKASNWEFGTNLLRNDLLIAGDKTRVKLAYFHNVTDDYIGRRWDDTKVNDAYLTLFNYDKVVMSGVELSGGYDVRKAFVDFAFNYYTDVSMCRTASTCTHGTGQADYIANQIPPKFTAAVTGGVRFLDDSLTIGGRYTFMGARAGTVQEDNYSKTLGIITKAWNPYSLVDAFAQWKINESLTLDVSAENLLDRYYVDALNNTDMPAPGRTIRVTLTGKLGSSTPWPEGSLFNRTPGAVAGADWSGFYVGAHVGQGFAALAGVTTAMDGTIGARPAAESADMNLNNFLAGGQVGINYQFENRFVIGIEADYAKTRIRGYRELLAVEGRLPQQRALEAKTDYDFDWMATIRGRAGYAFERLLVYGTGGAAFLKEKESRQQYRSDSASPQIPSGTTTTLFSTDVSEKQRAGWTIGAGGEYAVDAGWSLKTEYLYAFFGEQSFDFKNARAGVTRDYTVQELIGYQTIVNPRNPQQVLQIPIYANVVKPGTFRTINGRSAKNTVDLHTIKIGLNYRF